MATRRTTILLAALSCLLCVSQNFDVIDVHLVPHSHDDVGWLKTLNQYAEGWNSSIHNANVGLIYDSVVSQLTLDEKRRFTAVEMAFFEPWYSRQSQETQRIVHALVASGQLSFAGGGWVMHDEATTAWFDMLDQLTIGHDFLKRTFNVTPSVMWQIDPFGHSAMSASLFSQASGIHATFHSRVPFEEFAVMQRDQSREHHWRPSSALGESASVWASQMTHSTYCPPEWLNFDLLVSPNGLGRDPTLDDAFVAKIEAMIRSDVAVTRGRTVLVPMGCDFAYQQSQTWFKALDFLVGRLDDNNSTNSTTSRFVFRYSTPEQYLRAKAVETAGSARRTERDDELAVAESALVWPVKTTDMLPYDDGPTAVWSGFFSSRSALKRMIRRTSALCRQATTAAALRSTLLTTVDSDLRECRTAVAVAQHHDAVTGTSKQHVAFDYALTLHRGAVSAARALLKASSVPSSALPHNSDPCLVAWNQSTCPTIDRWNSQPLVATNTTVAADSLDLIIIVGNVLSRNRTVLVALPVRDGASVPVVVANNSELLSVDVGRALLSPSSLNPCAAYADTVEAGTCHTHTALLTLRLPALSTAVVRIKRPATSAQGGRRRAFIGQRVDQEVQLGDVTVSFSSDGRFVHGLTRNGHSATLRQEWCVYGASPGTKQQPQASGAYILRVASTNCQPLSTLFSSVSDETDIYPRPFAVVIMSSVLAVVEQEVAPFLTQRIAVGLGVESDIAVTYWLDDLPLDTVLYPNGVELVTRWRIGGAGSSPQTWAVDSNGRELIQRPVGIVSASGDIAAHFYPMNAVAVVASDSSNVSWAFFTDAPVAAGVLHRAEANRTTLELLLQRRLLMDDARGVGEALNETSHVASYTNCAQRLWAGGLQCGSHYGAGMRLQGSMGVSLVEGPPMPSQSLRDVKRWRARADAWLSPVVPIFALVGANVTTTAVSGAQLGEVCDRSGAAVTSVDVTNAKLRLRIANSADNAASSHLSPVNISTTELLNALPLWAKASRIRLMSLTFNQELTTALNATCELGVQLGHGACAPAPVSLVEGNISFALPLSIAALELLP